MLEARRYVKKLDIHYTLKHGSWLNITEIELHVMTRQYLTRRLLDIETIRKEVGTWEITTKDAKNKLTSLYPKLSQSEE